MSDYFPLDCSEKLDRIGLLVKQRRLELKMRQCDLASSVGVSNPTIGRIEAGERRVELATFMHVLWQLGCSAGGSLSSMLDLRRSRLSNVSA